jgi:hypothetical protein
MNTLHSTSSARPPVWRWVLLGLGICLAPLVLLALVAASYLTLDRDAAMLRKQVMAATATDWHTKVQLHAGSLSISAIRCGLVLVPDKDIAAAKLALAAVQHVSVGVYEPASGPQSWSREQLFTATDKTMKQSGWTRLVGVADKNESVLIYVNQEGAADGPLKLCLAVVSQKELVVVSTRIDAAKLAELVETQGAGALRNRLHLAHFHW